MSLSTPDARFLRLVGERCEREARIGEAHLLSIFRENLVSSFHYLTFVLGNGLSARFLNALPYDQLVHFRHERKLPSVFHSVNLDLGDTGYLKIICFFRY